MNTGKLAGLEPKNVFTYFEQICSIAHGSGNTRAISDYLVSIAMLHNVPYIQDDLNNIILFMPGTAGYEDHQPVIIQGHMDMVCEKDAGCAINMDTDGLDITHDGVDIFANGTTLGGDDGIAVAFILALLSDTSIAHPPIEAVITVDEETGMDGAAGIDLSMLKGRTMINIDSENEGIFTVSCAGGVKSTLSLPISRRTVYGPCVKLTVDGLRGGHSGVEIDKNRANANKIMGQLLASIQELMPVCITGISGGAKDNAIPRSCQVTLVAMGINLERINAITANLQEQVRQHYDEPDAIVRGDDVDALGGNALSTEDSAKVIALLNTVPNGIVAWSEDIPGLVQTSLNLGVARLHENFEMTFAVRSSVNHEKQALREKLREVIEFYGGSYSEKGDYPAWEYKKESYLRDTMVAVYRELFSKEPEIVAIHAGLECGLLSEKLPGLDCVSIGSDMPDIHTSREKLNIASTARTWNFLLKILESL